MAELIVIMLGSLFRMLLLGLFGALIERGVWTTDQVGQLAVGMAGFVFVAGWALYKRYHDRLKFLTALESPAGTDEATVTAKIGGGMGAKVLMLILAVAITGMAVTGCGPKTKPVLIRTDAAVYEAIQALHQTAIVLGQSGVITPAQELQIQQAILPVAKLGESATRVIAAWKSGPTPPELVRLVQEMGALTSRIVQILPGEAKGKAALLEKIALVQTALATVLLVTGGLS